MNRVSTLKGEETPLISIVVIDSRSNENPKWVKACLESIQNSWFKSWELFVIDNRDKTLSIGEAFNKGVSAATTKWVLFIGDDDFITKDYLYTLYNFAQEADKDLTNVCGVTSFGFLFDEANNKKGVLKKTPMGMWKTELLVEERFNEKLKNKVDVELLQRFIDMEYKFVTCHWCYGYYYRKHSGQVSGEKVMT